MIFKKKDSQDKQKTETKNTGIGFLSVWDSFFQNSPVATIAINKDGKIVLNNDSFIKFIQGKKSNEYNFFSIIKEENLSELKKFLEGKNSKKNKSFEVLFRNETSEKSLASITYVNPINNVKANGEDIDFIIYIINVSSQKDLEAQFVQSQKMQAVGQLAGGIAHDFNNLLTAMIGFCDLLLARHSPSDQSFADVMQIKQNSTRAANLVSQLLAFSRKQTLQPKLMNISDELAEISNLIRRLIGANIKLEIKHGKNLWDVKVDQVQLEQVLINLAVNARDAMINEGGTLTISTKNVVIDADHQISDNLIAPSDSNKIEESEYVVIEVTDTGHGMSKDTMQKIFEPFFTTKEVGKGTGLGLSTVYGIIKQTGGYIFVSSKERKGNKKNSGTTFSIYLKSHKVGKEQIKNVQSDEKNPDLTGTGTIMVVEDEPSVRMLSVRALKNKGYKVFEAESGEEALDIVKKRGGRIDLIISDVVMPGITGPSMIEKVLISYPKTKVIFISGYGEDVFGKSFGKKRDFNFLAKPFTLKELITKVKEVIVS